MKTLVQYIYEKLKITNKPQVVIDFNLASNYDLFFDTLVKYDKKLGKSSFNPLTGAYTPPFYYLDFVDEDLLPKIKVDAIKYSAITLYGLDYNAMHGRIIHIVYRLDNTAYDEQNYDTHMFKDNKTFVNTLGNEIITEIYNYMLDFLNENN